MHPRATEQPPESRPGEAPDLLKVGSATAEADVDPWEELEAARVREEKALTTIERLRSRIAALESWVDAAAAGRRVEYIQAQRLLLMKAAERDQRWSFVFFLPLALGAVYGVGVVILAWAFLEGRL